MATKPRDINALISRNHDSLFKPRVLSVRPGFKARKGWLTGERAIVVTVSRKLGAVPPDDLIPPQIGGVPTDVRQASAQKREELLTPKKYAAKLRVTPDTGSVPHFADERTVQGTKPAAAASAHAALAARVTKPKIEYAGPAGFALTPIEAPASVILSASPDAGWPVLKDFLKGTTRSLTVGLYDFTSAHILATVQAVLRTKQVKLTLDHPPLNPTADQSDEDTVRELVDAFGSDLDQAWALARLDQEASAWIYPTSYHIKVAVRDSAQCWLSSGNWNNSNQPDIDPFSQATDKSEARHRDRDWHVVIDQPELAGVFEAYLLNDLAIASQHNNPPAAVGPPIQAPALPRQQTRAFTTFFEPKTIQGTIKITPLLTPDPGVYAGAVKELIASAQQSLYLQFQYIVLPKAVDATSQAFVDLVQAVIDRQNAGVDVRIIMSEFEKLGRLEQLQAMGLDVVNKVKIQNNVHNKGIIVDGESVLISSQNWSTDGTLYNRDAGVILHNAEAAGYFQQIFLHDWDHLATRKALPD